ncbi:MAG: hypothetical protein ACRENS_13665, partial [Candidatus Eiseniibacteriota bacterium]
MRRVWVLAAASLCVELTGPSCAPGPAPQPLDAKLLGARCSSALAARERSARALTAEVSLWATLAGRKLPGVLAELSLAAPDRGRLRVSSPGGTLLDAVGTSERLRVWLPGDRTLADLTPCADSAGLGDLSALAVRAAGALWAPPD